MILKLLTHKHFLMCHHRSGARPADCAPQGDERRAKLKGKGLAKPGAFDKLAGRVKIPLLTIRFVEFNLSTVTKVAPAQSSSLSSRPCEFQSAKYLTRFMRKAGF